jgi:1-acyl-sn-glycerol-3-phosphate acyltransferase
MRSHGLLLLRNGTFYLCALAVSGLFALALPLIALPAPLARQIGWPIVTAYLRSILFLLKQICGLTFTVSGADKIVSTRPVLIASAHQSTWENLFFQIIFPNPAIIIKEEILRYPIAGAISRKNGHIPAFRIGDIHKIKESFRQAELRAKEGRSILIFPAGTRTGTAPPPPLRRGVAALYERLRLPCVPVAHNSGCLWRNGSWLRLPGTIIVQVLDPIPAGLDKATFLEALTTRLNTATEQLLREGEEPVLMPRMSKRAARVFADIQKAGLAQGADANRR